MQDSSPFRWFAERAPGCSLIAVIDDASSRLWARLVAQDTTEENLRMLGGWLQLVATVWTTVGALHR
jgi:hypothetical protein